MKIYELKIEGFKSIGEITLMEPNPFSVFVGPNASGKSNIFEALEFFELCSIISPREVAKLFGNASDILTSMPETKKSPYLRFSAKINEFGPKLLLEFAELNMHREVGIYGVESEQFPTFDVGMSNGLKELRKDKNYKQFLNFSRIFIGEPNYKVKRRNQDDSRLSSDASNLEKVLQRILRDVINFEEIIELLQLLIPGFSNIEIRTEELSRSENLVVYEEGQKKLMTKRLISDGTYNILALIAAIYQSDEPQFLCIEEPENGLNPKVVRQLVTLFREKCKEKGHYIWLNTHSQTLVSELTPDEIILVDKVDGLTQVKQLKGFDLHGMKMDEALLTNALGGGIPW